MKLPINPLLHLISLAAVGGIVMSYLEFEDNESQFKVDREKISGDIKKLSESAIGPRQHSGRWDYNATAFWQNFAEVNLTGKVKRVEVETAKEPEKKETGPADLVDLNQILTVIAITRGGGRTGAVVDYSATVEVPEALVSGPAANVIAKTLPAGRLNRGGVIPTLPTASAGSSPPHHLQIGDHLWPPYEHVFLLKVATDASAVLFELRVDSAKKDDKYPIQEIFKNELGLPQDVADSLRAHGKKTVSVPKGTGGDDLGSVAAASGFKWEDRLKTEVDSHGNVMINRKDSQWLRENGSQVFNEDVSMRDYSSIIGGQKVRGVQFRKLSPRVRQFGAQEGDVVISLNNQPINGMAHAKRIGQRLHNRGVRSFRAEVLRRGERLILTFHLEDKK